MHIRRTQIEIAAMLVVVTVVAMIVVVIIPQQSSAEQVDAEPERRDEDCLV